MITMLARTLRISLTLGLLTLGAAGNSSEPPHAPTSASITAADISVRVKAIANDYFEGRGPGTSAGEQAAQWIADEMKRVGLKPGNGNSYFQEVPAVAITMDPMRSTFAVTGRDGTKPFKFGDDAMWWSPQYQSANISINDASLVFVGYGVTAPEERWNDYANIDVRGKIVVVLINDPGFLTNDASLFKGRAMTYYGRWTYKFEEAARRGAAGVIIVHETEPAAYGWQVVQTGRTGPQLYLETSDKNRQLVSLQSWITHEAAQALFARAGLDYDALKIAANSHGFKPVLLAGLTASASITSSIESLTTRNVVGVIPGSKRPDEYVLYTAHWDHLGARQGLSGADTIYNGAVDNGMGVAMTLEIGEAFAKMSTPPERSIALLFPTLEEQGLLGSEYFAAHPLWPLKNIIAGINLDGGLPGGKARDMVVVGTGASELEDLFADVLKTQNRVITPDPEPEKGYFYRSDHVSLAKVGVPMLDPGGGFDLLNGGVRAGEAIRDDYVAKRYHQPTDEFDPNWDLSGPLEDVNAFYALGWKLSDSVIRPNWYSGNEFRAIRDASMTAK